MPDSDGLPTPGEILWFQIKDKVQILIWPPIRLGVRPQLLSPEHASRHTAGVIIVSCCKQSATIGTCCLQSSSVVLTTSTSNRRRTSCCFVYYTQVRRKSMTSPQPPLHVARPEASNRKSAATSKSGDEARLESLVALRLDEVVASCPADADDDDAGPPTRTR